MIELNSILLLLYLTIIVVWIWARFKFFKIDSDHSRIGSYLYDPVVAIQIFSTCYYFVIREDIHISAFLSVLTLYLVAIGLFALSIKEAKSLNFALSDQTHKIITTGTYRIVRHPLYVSYFLVWLSNTILFNSSLLWITLLYLALFYYFSAKTEENKILRSSYSREYEEYRRNVGMFLPRIKGWKS